MPEGKKPNILFIFSDQHKEDVMGCASHPIVQSPNLDRLAREGQRFTRAWTQCPVCQPCRATVITGGYTQDIGFSANQLGASIEEGPYRPEWPTVMKQLQAGGYETASIGKTHYHSVSFTDEQRVPMGKVDTRDFADFVKQFGWDYVFEEYDRYGHASEDLRSPYMEHLEAYGLLEAYREQLRSIFRLTPEHWRGATSVCPQEHELSSFIADHAIDWLKGRDSEKPFYLNLGFVQPHVPLVDDPTWAAYYENADIQLPDMTTPEAPNEVWDKKLSRMKAHSQHQTMTEEFVREGIRHYLGAVSLVDQKIGDVLNALEELGELDNTWVIYSSDHGEMLGEHHLWAKFCFYDGSVRIPLIISPPDRKGRGEFDGLTELIDVTSTIADIGQVDPPELARGTSLLPALEGEFNGHEHIFSSIDDFTCVRNEQYRFTIDNPSRTPCELFDLTNDPDETTNLVDDRNQESVIRELTQVIREHRLPIIPPPCDTP